MSDHGSDALRRWLNMNPDGRVATFVGRNDRTNVYCSLRYGGGAPRIASGGGTSIDEAAVAALEDAARGGMFCRPEDHVLYAERREEARVELERILGELEAVEADLSSAQDRGAVELGRLRATLDGAAQRQESRGTALANVSAMRKDVALALETRDHALRTIEIGRIALTE